MSNLEKRVTDLEAELREVKRALELLTKATLRRDAKASLKLRKLSRHLDDYKRVTGRKS